MTRYIVKRLGQAVLVLWAAYTLSFLLLSALPGDAVNNRIQNPDQQISPEAAAALIAYYGLDQPLWQQYLQSLQHLVQGDLGFSITTGLPVAELIGAALPSTLALTSLALLIGLILAAVIGVAAHYAPWSWLRSAATSVPPLFGAVPTFVVGILILQYFSFSLHVIPSTDDGTFLALIGPATTLGILIAAPLAQVFVAAIGQTRKQPFVHVLQARGAGQRYAFGRGVLRNSALPVVTLLGLAVGELIAGSVVTEAVFARPGIGQLTVTAVNTQDLPVLQGVVVVATVAFVLVNLAVDLLYPFLDPRLSYVQDGRTRVRAGLFGLWLGPLARRRSRQVTPTEALPAEVVMP